MGCRKSLLCFAIGPVFLLLNLATRSQTPFLLFLGFAALYSYYHVVRQHYGFLAIYKVRNRDFNPVYRSIDKWFLYAGCWLPYVYFVFTHPKARRLLWILGEERSAGERWIAYAILGLWALSFVVFLGAAASDFRIRVRQPHVIYAFLTAVLYGVIYLFVAHYEPVYTQSQGPDQDFLLISILVPIFHNIQYIGLVWFYNRNRYAIDGGAGIVGGVTRSFARYVGVLILFSGVIYLVFASATGVFPTLQLFRGANVGPFTLGQLGLCLWWGLAINHYYLDQKIWRVRNDDELKRNLGLA